MIRRRKRLGRALGSAALVVGVLGALFCLVAAAAAPDLAVDPGLRPRSPALGLDTPTTDTAPPPPPPPLGIGIGIGIGGGGFGGGRYPSGGQVGYPGRIRGGY